LADRDEPRGAVDLARRDMDDARRAQLARRLHDVHRALRIGAQISLRRDVRVGDTDERREVEDNLLLRHRVAHGIPIRDVAEANIDGLARRRGVEPAGGAEGVVADEHADLGAILDEPLDEVAADEAAAAGDEDFAPFNARAHRSSARAGTPATVAPAS